MTSTAHSALEPLFSPIKVNRNQMHIKSVEMTIPNPQQVFMVDIESRHTLRALQT